MARLGAALSDTPLSVDAGGTGATTPTIAKDNLEIAGATVASSLGGLVGLPGYSVCFRIEMSSGSGGSDGFQRQLLIGESALAAGVDFHLRGRSKSFPTGENVGGELQFVTADGKTVPFYVERVTGTAPDRTATVWVALPNGTSADVIFLLADNFVGVTDQSDPGTVFPRFFDSFPGTSLDQTKWAINNSTGLSVGSGSMRHTSNSARIRSIAEFSANDVILETLWNGTTRAANGHTVVGFAPNSGLGSNAIGYLWHPGQDYIRVDSAWGGLGAALPSATEIVTRVTPISSGFFNFVTFRHENYDTGALLQTRLFGNVVSNERIWIGQRFDSAFTGQAMDMSWRWVRIRQAGRAPGLVSVVEV